MDVTTTILLLAGTAAVAIVIAVSVAAYKGVFGRANPKSINTSLVSEVIASTTSNPVPQVQAVSEQAKEESEFVSQIVQEAPAPFPEDSIASTAVRTNTTSVPTDISAIAGISSASSAGSPVLVISTPKRRRSSATKRLPSTAGTAATPRKRRSTRKQQQPDAIVTSIAPTTPIVTIADASTESVSASDATTTEPQPSHQEV